MKPKEETTALYIDIPKTRHKKLKILAAAKGKSLKKLVLEALDILENECRFHSHLLNNETDEAIKESYSKKKLVKAENIEDFFKKLGI